MKRIVLGLAVVLLVTASASAEDLFAVAYGNTVTQTMPDGTKTTIYVNADKSWEQHRADGTVMKGTYTWQDDTHACFTMTDPAPKDPTKATNCNEIKAGHKVGDTWTEAAPNGQSITMSITAGR